MIHAAQTATVLITGDDVWEDLFGASLELAAITVEAGLATRSRVGLGAFAELAASGDLPDVLVLYTAMGESTPAQQRALTDAVDAGMGVLAVHTAGVFPSENGRIAASHRELFELLGSRYSSHGPQPHESRFEVRLDSGHPITAGLDDFAITHEHYELELAPVAPTVIAWRDTPAGREPLMTVAEHGAGRVCYLQLGHDMRVWQEPTVRALIVRALAWATRGEVA